MESIHGGLGPPMLDEEASTAERPVLRCTCGTLLVEAEGSWTRHHLGCVPFWKWRLRHRQVRLEKLVALDAPPPVIDKEHELIARAEEGLRVARESSQERRSG